MLGATGVSRAITAFKKRKKREDVENLGDLFSKTNSIF